MRKTKTNYPLTLLQAVQKGDMETVQSLVERGADVNLIGDDGQTPLLEAARNGYTEIASYLIDHRARPYIVDKQGRTALGIARINGHTDTAEMIQRKMQHPFVGVGQYHLISAMQALGYESNNEGVCHGLACMASQAILAEDLETFQDRLNLLYSMLPGEIVSAIMNNPDDPLLNSIHAFFQGIELYQSPNRYADWFRDPSENTTIYQRDDKAMNLVLPVKLGNDGGVASPLKSTSNNQAPKSLEFTGVYDNAELAELFHSLNEIMKSNASDNPGALRTPLSFLLSSWDHHIEVAYESTSGSWLLIDANQIPFVDQCYDNFHQLAEAISLALNFTNEPNPIVMSTKIQIKESQKEYLNPIFDEWQCQDSFKNTHTIIRGSDKINYIDKRKATWLLLAAKQGDIDTLKKLINHGADVTLSGRNVMGTPLTVASQNGDIDIVETLLMNNANVNATASDNVTALFYASQNGNSDIVEMLLTNGANVNATHQGVTPLMISIQNGHTRIVEILLKNGAAINEFQDTGFTPLTRAAETGNIDIIELLLKYGADVNPIHASGITPLYMAAQNGHLSIAELLLKNHAKVDAALENGITALFIAANSNHGDIVDLLLQNKADVNLAHSSGATPLWIASQNGHASIVSALLKMGADINVNVPDQGTPMQIAKTFGRTEVIEVLNNYQSAPMPLTEEKPDIIRNEFPDNSQRHSTTAMLRKSMNITQDSVVNHSEPEESATTNHNANEPTPAPNAAANDSDNNNALSTAEESPKTKMQ